MKTHREFWFMVAASIVSYILITYVFQPIAAKAKAPTPTGTFVPGGGGSPAGGASGQWLL